MGGEADGGSSGEKRLMFLAMAAGGDEVGLIYNCN